jgi:hypothetical protein
VTQFFQDATLSKPPLRLYGRVYGFGGGGSILGDDDWGQFAADATGGIAAGLVHDRAGKNGDCVVEGDFAGGSVGERPSVGDLEAAGAGGSFDAGCSTDFFVDDVFKGAAGGQSRTSAEAEQKS